MKELFIHRAIMTVFGVLLVLLLFKSGYTAWVLCPWAFAWGMAVRWDEDARAS